MADKWFDFVAIAGTSVEQFGEKKRHNATMAEPEWKEGNENHITFRHFEEYSSIV
jgi:hypothetical protein